MGERRFFVCLCFFTPTEEDSSETGALGGVELRRIQVTILQMVYIVCLVHCIINIFVDGCYVESRFCSMFLDSWKTRIRLLLYKNSRIKHFYASTFATKNFVHISYSSTFVVDLVLFLAFAIYFLCFSLGIDGSDDRRVITTNQFTSICLIACILIWHWGTYFYIVMLRCKP